MPQEDGFADGYRSDVVRSHDGPEPNSAWCHKFIPLVFSLGLRFCSRYSRCE
jgi:hypothetical protein